MLLHGIIAPITTPFYPDGRVYFRYWPVALIALGAYMLYERVSSTVPHGNSSPGIGEATHERH